MAEDGRRLSKRDKDLDLGELQKRMKPTELIGHLALAAGLMDREEAISAGELAKEFCWNRLRSENICINQRKFY